MSRTCARNLSAVSRPLCPFQEYMIILQGQSVTANDLMCKSLVHEEDTVIGMSPLKQEVGFLRVVWRRDRMDHFIIFLQ